MLVSNITYYYCIIASINVNYIFLVFIFFGKYYPIFWITNDIDNKRLNVSIIQRINDREKEKNYKIYLLLYTCCIYTELTKIICYITKL